jgi:ABC-type branched-subunit amino acid transport system ATPase component
MEQQVILERDAELAALAAAIAAAEAGHGTLALVEGPAGIGKTTLLRAACQGPAPWGARVLTARGLALEQGFPYGIVRQLLDPVRGEDGVMDGAATVETHLRHAFRKLTITSRAELTLNL